jgi:hypothetical protein
LRKCGGDIRKLNPKRPITYCEKKEATCGSTLPRNDSLDRYRFIKKWIWILEDLDQWNTLIWSDLLSVAIR